MHAEADYAAMWVGLYEDIVRNGVITMSTGYPVLVNGRYVMATTPIPRWDVPRLHRATDLNLFGAGREKRIYAVPPHTDGEPLTFDDVPFEVERTPGARCARCGTRRHVPRRGRRDGGSSCSDTDWCARRRGDATGGARRGRRALDARSVAARAAARPVDRRAIRAGSVADGPPGC